MCEEDDKETNKAVIDMYKWIWYKFNKRSE